MLRHCVTSLRHCVTVLCHCVIVLCHCVTVIVLRHCVTVLQSNVNPLVPTLVFGVTSLVAGGLALRLPETKGKHLPQTLDELVGT